VVRPLDILQAVHKLQRYLNPYFGAEKEVINFTLFFEILISGTCDTLWNFCTAVYSRNDNTLRCME
jgi:hypothetical protein